jgi:hypothetical protein
MGPLNNSNCPTITSLRANCKVNALWLQQLKLVAKNPLKSYLFSASPIFDFMNIYEGPREAESLLAI